jgi:SAM-dependent methyltransferase
VNQDAEAEPKLKGPPAVNSLGSGQGNKQSYRARFAELARDLTREDAVKIMVGPGDFERVGFIERGILKRYGLQGNEFVVDVGCGSGRLARYLTGFPGLRYLGIDVVPDLLDWAREQCGRDDWVFQETTGFSIPIGDDEADFVTFFRSSPTCCTSRRFSICGMRIVRSSPAGR